MEHEFIYYVHDGSETLSDSFTVGANDTGLRKHSGGRTVYVQLTPVNDEPPVVTANRVLRVGLRCRAACRARFSACRSASVASSCVGWLARCHGWVGGGEAMPVMWRRARWRGAGGVGLAFIWKGPSFSCS